MPNDLDQRYDFFLSRRGSVAAVAREVADVLTEQGYRVLVQDYDIRFGDNFIEKMHIGIKNSRDLIILFTSDYEHSAYTRKEFTSFEAQRLRSAEERHIVVLLCEDTLPAGLLADVAYQTLVGVEDPQDRKCRIIAAAERHSQATAAPPRPFIGVPPRLASFTGRVDELDRLDAILMHNKPAAVTQAVDKPAGMTQPVGRAALQGMGGVGKTSLAIEYAHRYRKLYAGVCWCPAETRAGLLTALAALAVRMGAASAIEGDDEKGAKAALDRLAEQRATWLLVYDNVPSPDDIADLLPSGGARVLVTSRFADWVRVADEVPLGMWPPAEAIDFLQACAGRGDPPGAAVLAHALGYLPLALDHAAAYCKRMGMHFSDYAIKAKSLIDTLLRGAGHPRSVAATFNLAISAAVSQCTAAEELMAFLAQCGPERIPMVLVDGAINDEHERLQALAALVEVSLVKHDPFEDGTESITVHRVVQAVARARSEKGGAAPAAVERLLARLEAIYPEKDGPGSWMLSRQLTPHLSAMRLPEADLPRWVGLIKRASGYKSNTAPLLRNLMEAVLGPEHLWTAAGLAYLARQLQAEGNFALSQSFFERTVAIYEKALSEGRELSKDRALAMANALDALGRADEAKALRERYGLAEDDKPKPA